LDEVLPFGLGSPLPLGVNQRRSPTTRHWGLLRHSRQL